MRNDPKERMIDEMNLAEFPMALLCDRAISGLKTLEFHVEHGTLIVTGADKYGLPTAPDTDVIVGLVNLTRIANDFTDPTVSFTRYELLKLIGWPDRGQYYKRLNESLRRWVGVTLEYQKCWWDNQVKRRTDEYFHILEHVKISDGDDGAESSFTWNGVFFKSCQAGYLKGFDVDTYFGLASHTARQAYRFLDKRFYRRGSLTFDLREFAVGHIGLSPNYTDAKLREKLKPALRELEEIGFLRADPERFRKAEDAVWTVRLARHGGKAVGA